MGETKKAKKKCCHKFEKKGNQCSSCPLTGQDESKKSKKEKLDEKEKTRKKK
jgi:hypothetical protein